MQAQYHTTQNLLDKKTIRSKTKKQLFLEDLKTITAFLDSGLNLSDQFSAFVYYMKRQATITHFKSLIYGEALEFLGTTPE